MPSADLERIGRLVALAGLVVVMVAVVNVAVGEVHDARPLVPWLLTHLPGLALKASEWAIPVMAGILVVHYFVQPDRRRL
jgi:hypothetical protein